MTDMPTGFFIFVTGGSFLTGVVVGILLFKIFGKDIVFAFGRGATFSERKRKEQLIVGVKNFDELYDVLKTIGPVRGTRYVYTPEELMDLIYMVSAYQLMYTIYIGKPGEPWYERRSRIAAVLEEMTKRGEDPLKLITRAYGLRDKVRELIEKEKKKMGYFW